MYKWSDDGVKTKILHHQKNKQAYKNNGGYSFEKLVKKAIDTNIKVKKADESKLLSETNDSFVCVNLLSWTHFSNKYSVIN